MIESLDACMGLARKKKKGGGLVEPRHEELMFSDQTDVDNFVDNYGKEGIKIEEVSMQGRYWSSVKALSHVM